jgi:hypothetical protein
MKLITLFMLLLFSVSTFAADQSYVKKAIKTWELEDLNTYLESNSQLVSKTIAKEALEILNLEYVKNPAIINTELNQRLRNIAF